MLHNAARAILEAEVHTEQRGIGVTCSIVDNEQWAARSNGSLNYATLIGLAMVSGVRMAGGEQTMEPAIRLERITW